MLPGVTVTVTNTATSQVRTVVTGSDGFYTVPLLPPGRYDVKATLAGFKTVIRDGITVDVGVTSRVDLKLAVGGVEENVTVSTDAPLVETTHATLGIADRAEEDRRPAAERPQLHAARHAASPASSRRRRRSAARPATRRRAASARPPAGFNVNGMRNQSNNFLLDGASNNDTFNTGFVLRPPPDAIQEFKILTHSYSAEYGRNSGSVVNVVTRAGTNALHGAALGVQPRRRAAGAELLRAADQPKPKLKQNQFGGSAGRADRQEPAVRVRLLRRLPQHAAAAPRTSSSLSDAQRAGDFRRRRRSAIR